MQQMIGNIMKTYGVSITRKAEGVTYRGFFQPVRSKSWQYLEGNYSPLGEVPRGQYVYIGPVEPGAQAGDTLTVDGKNYWLRRAELIRAGNGPVYCWGMCVEKGGEDNWGRQS